MYIIRYLNQSDLRRLEHESRWAHTREIIATIVNVNRDPKKPPIKGRDLIQLSFDQEEILKEENLQMIEKANADFFKMMKSRMGSKAKKDASK